MPSGPDERSHRRAPLLVHGDTATGRVRLSGYLRLAVLGEGAALGLIVVALLLPWSREDAATQNAFAGATALDVLALLAAGGTAVTTALFAAAPGARSARALLIVSVATGIPALVAGLAVVGGADTDERQWWGLGLLAPALIAAMGFAALVRSATPVPGRAQGQRDASLPAVAAGRGRYALVLPGVAALGLAAAGLTTSWQRLTGSVVDALTDGDALVWRGTELSGTLALRWAVPAGLALCLLLAAIRPTRRALPLALIAAGAAVTALTVVRLPRIPVQGTNASIEIGIGAWLTFAGGVIALLCGLAALHVPGLTRGRAALPAAAAVIIIAPLVTVAVPPAGASAGTSAGTSAGAQQILGAEDDTQPRLGVPAVHAAYATTPRHGPGVPHLPTLAGSLDGGSGTWFLAPVDVGFHESAFVIEEIVDGRALPVTVVYGPEQVQLLGVSGHHAVVYVYNNPDYFVSVIDLRRGHAETDPRISDGDWSFGTMTVLTNSVRSMRPSQALSPGVVRADELRVELRADGSAVVRVEPRNDDLDEKSYRVDAATVRGTEPWRLTNPVGADRSGATAPARYATGATAIWRIDRGGARHVVVGGVSDRRCRPSRDPLSSAIFTYGHSAVPDRDGNVWMVVAPYLAPPSQLRLYVLTPDGVLRSASPRWGQTLGVQPQPDGSLYVTLAGRGGGVFPGAGVTYRIADSGAFARDAAPLPPVADDCVSDNRVTVHTEGRPVRRVGPAPDIRTGAGQIVNTALLDADATVLASRHIEQPDSDERGNDRDRWELLRATPGHRANVVYRTSSGRIEGLVADGRGGAWWFERHLGKTSGSAHDGTGSFGHIDASGHARIVARGIVLDDPSRGSVALAVDRADGSLWWWTAHTWHRTTLSGTTTEPRYQHAAEHLILVGSEGFAVEDDIVYRISAGRAGLGPAALGSESGRDLRLPSAIASGADASEVDAEGIVLATSERHLLLYQGDYLAVLETSGRLHALAGPDDGLPAEAEVDEICVIADTLVIETDDDVIYTMDLS